MSNLKRPLVQDWVVSSFDDFKTKKLVVKAENVRGKLRSIESTSSRINHVSSNQRVPPMETLWIDKYHPQSEDQLAVHKKKLEEVRSWFEVQGINIKNKGSSTGLLLTGPAGACKTATVRLLAKEIGFDVCEWINRPGVVADYGNQQFDESQTSTFKDFLLRSGQYSNQIFVGDNDKKKIILIEDFPPKFSTRVNEMHNILRTYFKVSSCPVVFIVTDSASNASNERTLFPAHFQQETNITHISFNPVANTNMLRVLMRIAESEQLIANITKETMEALVESSKGDIRSAINALQFSCDIPMTMKSSLKTTQSSTSKIKSISTSRRRARHGQSKKSNSNLGLQTETTTTLTTFVGRDDSLFLFHVLGKILHCKRDASQSVTSSVNLKKMERLPLLVNPEEVWGKSSTSPSTFSVFLHQNYPPFMTDIDELSGASNYLSLSDIFLGDWTGLEFMNLYAVSLATRGIMYFRTEKTTGGFRPFHKPKLFSIQQSCNEISEKSRSLFTDKFFNLSRGDLFCQVIPYLREFVSSSLTNDEKSFISYNFQPFTGKVNLRHQYDLLNEKEVETVIENDNLDREHCTVDEHDDDDQRVFGIFNDFDNDADDKYVIEEFDD